MFRCSWKAYHPVIEEARDNSFLKDFRRWISENAASTDPKELATIKLEVENAISEVQRDLFLKYLDRGKQIFGMGKTLAGAAADIFLPGVGVAVDIVERFGEIRAAGKLRWQGFLVSLEDAKSG